MTEPLRPRIHDSDPHVLIGPAVAVRADPARRFGAPAIKGISCEAIALQMLAGDDIATIAEDYDLTRADILVACWYLGLYGSRRWRRSWRQWAEQAGQAMWDTRTVDYDQIPDPPLP
jgi:uncharacterized protein (DUF433 family)